MLSSRFSERMRSEHLLGRDGNPIRGCCRLRAATNRFLVHTRTQPAETGRVVSFFPVPHFPRSARVQDRSLPPRGGGGPCQATTGCAVEKRGPGPHPPGGRKRTSSSSPLPLPLTLERCATATQSEWRRWAKTPRGSGGSARAERRKRTLQRQAAPGQGAWQWPGVRKRRLTREAPFKPRTCSRPDPGDCDPGGRERRALRLGEVLRAWKNKFRRTRTRPIHGAAGRPSRHPSTEAP